MRLSVQVSFLKALGPDVYDEYARFRNDKQFVDIEADELTEKQLDLLYDKAKNAGGDDSKAKGLFQRISSYRNIRANPVGKPVKTLETLVTALRAYIQPSPNKWLFFTNTDGFVFPYYVARIQHYPPRDQQPASVVMTLAAISRNESAGKSVSFGGTDLGKTVDEILSEEGLYLETEAGVKAYWEDIALYKKYSPQTGAQFNCVGTSLVITGYRHDTIAMEREGQPTKVVLDDISEGEERDRSGRRSDSGVTTSTAFWNKKDIATKGDDESEGSVVTPVHPYVQVFDLDRHEFVSTHVRNLTPYEYDKTAAAKLVLPQDKKDLVTLLVEGSNEIMEDIIRGKTGGTIVISTGPPGTGKTLTAEVFSEEIRRPLYVVQCSQLGTNEEEVEKQLQLVLTRASRWGAILLIDEADVYVHERGTDIQQNAIVGVFLRVLEHHRGVLFLTSNRATVIDDAIMSRATAWLRYDYPTKEELGCIWKVLSKQYQLPLSEDTVKKLVEEFPNISGRNVKNMLKLSRLLMKASKKAKSDVEMFRYVSTFLHTNKPA